jgi:hypothetical protein
MIYRALGGTLDEGEAQKGCRRIMGMGNDTLLVNCLDSFSLHLRFSKSLRKIFAHFQNCHLEPLVTWSTQVLKVLSAISFAA